MIMEDIIFSANLIEWIKEQSKNKVKREDTIENRIEDLMRDRDFYLYIKNTTTTLLTKIEYEWMIDRIDRMIELLTYKIK